MSHFNSPSHRKNAGMTLIEIIAEVVLISIVGVLGMRHVRTAGTQGQDRACELTRRTLQNEVEHYQRINRRLPSSDLRELTASEYWNGDLPTCPESKNKMRIDREGDVVCPTHSHP